MVQYVYIRRKRFLSQKRKKNTFIIAALKQEKGGSYG